MPSRSSLNVSLTPELEKFIGERVSTGRYQTASEVVREGLRLLELQERDRDEARRVLKAKLKRGAAQAEAGEVVEGDEFLDNLISRLKKSTGKARSAENVSAPRKEAEKRFAWHGRPARVSGLKIK